MQIYILKKVLCITQYFILTLYSKAAKKYLSTRKKSKDGLSGEYKDKLLENNTISTNNNINNNRLNNSSNSNRSNIVSNRNSNSNNNEGYFTSYVKRPLSYIASFFCSKCYNNNTSNQNFTIN